MALAAQVMSTDISSLLGMHVDALIGNDILKHFAICFDYGQGEITFSDEGLTLPRRCGIYRSIINYSRPKRVPQGGGLEMVKKIVYLRNYKAFKTP